MKIFLTIDKRDENNALNGENRHFLFYFVQCLRHIK